METAGSVGYTLRIGIKPEKTLRLPRIWDQILSDAFHNDYKDGVAEFEQKTGIQMHEDIAVLLGG